MNTLTSLNTITSPHLVGGALPQALVTHLARDDGQTIYKGHFLGNYVQFLAEYGNTPNVLRDQHMWGDWMNRCRNGYVSQDAAKLLSLFFLAKWQEDARIRTRWDHIHDLAAYAALENHACLRRNEVMPAFRRLSDRQLRLVMVNLRQAYKGNGNIHLLQVHIDALERGVKDFKWELPRGIQADTIREELKATPPTPENIWFWEWAEAYYFRATQGPIFLNTWQALPPAVQAFVTRYAGPKRRGALTQLLPYQKAALAQCLLAPPLEVFPNGIPKDWMHTNALGNATQRMTELCALSLEHTPRQLKGTA